MITDLDAALPRASVAAVVDSANRTGASCSPHPKAVAAFCWESGDNATTDWYPQGITTSADASALPAGPEDFSYWQSRDQLWTLAEHPGHRSVLAVKASAF